MFAQKGFFYPLDYLNPLLLRSPLFTWDTNIFTFVAHSEKSIHIPLPQTSLSSHVIYKFMPIQPNHWPQCMNHYRLTPLIIFPSKQNEQQGALLEVLTTRKISLHHSPSGLSQKAAVVLQMSTFGGACTLYRNIYKPGTSLLFLSQLIVENSFARP